jgi:hypothetical protein
MNDEQLQQLTQETRERFKDLLRPSLFSSVFGLPTDEEIDDIIRSALDQVVRTERTAVRLKHT